MPPKRKNDNAEGNKQTKKTKSTASSAQTASVDDNEWRKKSIDEFGLTLVGNQSDQNDDADEWKMYYENRKKALAFHTKTMESEDNLGMQELIMEQMEKVVKANTKLTDKEKANVLSQFLITELEACFEDSGLDDLRSCTIGVSAYSDHSYSSVNFVFDYHFRVRGYGVEFSRSFKYANRAKPSSQTKKTVWYANGAPSEYKEDRKFKLSIGQLEKLKKLLFSKTICEKLSNYELVQLTSESIGQFGETGHVKDDDWIGYHNRILCGCPTEDDRNYVHPTFEKPKRGLRQRDSDDEDDDRDSDEDNSDSDYSSRGGCAQQ